MRLVKSKPKYKTALENKLKKEKIYANGQVPEEDELTEKINF